MKHTLPTDSAARKEYPLHRGLLRYFPAALAGVARISKIGNDKHNPGQDMHHSRGKSADHGDCILRHLIDLEEALACIDKVAPERRGAACERALDEASHVAWRALALSQELHEKLGGAPLAPGAKMEVI
jgi:hypothetical protein